MTLSTTPECIGSQTVGPYYVIGLGHLVSDTLAGPNATGTHVTISGTLFDADGEPVPDAILELWQASPEGQYVEAQELGSARSVDGFLGFARLSTHESGRFSVKTVVPGPVAASDGGVHAPHIVVTLFMRGLMRHLVTRVYFPDQAGNATDPILLRVPEARRSSLLSQRIDGSLTELAWNIHLQGPHETVFFSC